MSDPDKTTFGEYVATAIILVIIVVFITKCDSCNKGSSYSQQVPMRVFDLKNERGPAIPKKMPLRLPLK